MKGSKGDGFFFFFIQSLDRQKTPVKLPDNPHLKQRHKKRRPEVKYDGRQCLFNGRIICDDIVRMTELIYFMFNIVKDRSVLNGFHFICPVEQSLFRSSFGICMKNHCTSKLNSTHTIIHLFIYFILSIYGFFAFSPS